MPTGCTGSWRAQRSTVAEIRTVASYGAVLGFAAALAPVAPAQHLMAQSTHTLSSLPTCGDCRIVLDSGEVLDLRSDSISFDIGTRMARIANGFLAWDIAFDNRSRLAFFSHSGAFERMIARAGQGPGELSEVIDVVRGPGDSISVIEQTRRHVFTAAMQYARTSSLPIGFGDLLIVDPDTGVLAAVIRTPERYGFPLHLIDGSGNVLRSFGTTDPAIDERRLTASGDNVGAFLRRRVVPAAEEHAFWVFNTGRFLLEKYDLSGRRLAKAAHGMDGWYADASRRFPGGGEDKGLSLSFVVPSHDPSVVFLVYHDGQERLSGLRSADVSGGGIAKLLDLVVEAVDTRTFAVLAVGRFSGNRAMPVIGGEEELALIRALNAEEHTYQVVRLRLVR